jgi:hypothetical protein
MKTMSAILISLMITASNALAAGGAPEGGGSCLMTECLLALLVMIVLFQFIPGMTLLIDMVKGIFAQGKQDSQADPADK